MARMTILPERFLAVRRAAEDTWLNDGGRAARGLATAGAAGPFVITVFHHGRLLRLSRAMTIVALGRAGNVDWHLV